MPELQIALNVNYAKARKIMDYLEEICMVSKESEWGYRAVNHKYLNRINISVDELVARGVRLNLDELYALRCICLEKEGVEARMTGPTFEPLVKKGLVHRFSDRYFPSIRCPKIELIDFDTDDYYCSFIFRNLAHPMFLASLNKNKEVKKLKNNPLVPEVCNGYIDEHITIFKLTGYKDIFPCRGIPDGAYNVIQHQIVRSFLMKLDVDCLRKEDFEREMERALAELKRSKICSSTFKEYAEKAYDLLARNMSLAQIEEYRDFGLELDDFSDEDDDDE